MWRPSRRGLLGRLLAVLPGAPLARSLLAVTDPHPGAVEATLRALAEVMLPTAELGPTGVGSVVQGFQRWSEGLTPGAELDHPYLWSDEIRYGPDDPRPRWAEQLAALESASRRAHGRALGEVPAEARRGLVETWLPRPLPERLEHPAETEHVGIALVAFFVQAPAANDLCYRAAIGRYACRGLPSVGAEPSPLEPPRGRPSR
jgi:hypothetical protein